MYVCVNVCMCVCVCVCKCVCEREGLQQNIVCLVFSARANSQNERGTSLERERRGYRGREFILVREEVFYRNRNKRSQNKDCVIHFYIHSQCARFTKTLRNKK